MLEDTITLMKENDFITRKFREKGVNVDNYRNYIKKSKQIVDKQSSIDLKKASEKQLKIIILKLEEIKQGNLKINQKFKEKIKKVQIKDKTVNINIDIDRQKKSSIFPNEKEIKEIKQKLQLKDQIDSNQQQKVKTFTEHQNQVEQMKKQGQMSNALNLREREMTRKYYGGVKELQQSIGKYNQIYKNLLLNYFNQNLTSQTKNQEQTPNFQHDMIYSAIKDVGILIQENQQQDTPNTDELSYQEQVKKVFYRHNAIINFTKSKLVKIN